MDNAHASRSERSARLRDDQPFTGTTSENYRDAKISAPEAEVRTHLTASSSSLNGNGLRWLNGLPLPEIPRLTHSLLTISAFYLTGCGLQRQQSLLPRDRNTAPDANFHTLHQSRASL
ncbi:TPA: hypothetical protein N2G30_002226 [Salmonella enterica]|nr:hypothetical protein [Salmonella enterica]